MSRVTQHIEWISQFIDDPRFNHDYCVAEDDVDYAHGQHDAARSILGALYRSGLISEIAMLRSRNHFLNCLEAAGVDSWEGYDEAKERYTEEAEAGNVTITVRGGIESKTEVGKI